ncbi:ferredoxin [archaeon]|nr:ferredoxin [archaeon]
MYSIKFNKKECIGCGACAQQCPDNWEIIEDGEGYKAKPKHTALEKIGCNEEAANICPVEAIKIIKGNKNKFVEEDADED